MTPLTSVAALLIGALLLLERLTYVSKAVAVIVLIIAIVLAAIDVLRPHVNR